MVPDIRHGTRKKPSVSDGFHDFINKLETELDNQKISSLGLENRLKGYLSVNSEVFPMSTEIIVDSRFQRYEKLNIPTRNFDAYREEIQVERSATPEEDFLEGVGGTPTKEYFTRMQSPTPVRGSRVIDDDFSEGLQGWRKPVKTNDDDVDAVLFVALVASAVIGLGVGIGYSIA